MRIILVTLYYFPDAGGTPGVYKDLCESLAARGHDIVVVTGFPRYNVTSIPRRYRGKLWLSETINGVDVRRIRTIGLPRYIPAARAFEYLFTAVALFFRALFLREGDAALIHAPTLYEGVAGVVLRRLKSMPFVLNVHDIFPQTAVDLGLISNRTLIGLFRRLERYLYRTADWVTVHSPGNREWIAGHGGSLERTSVMPIWMNVGALKPGPRENSWSRRQGLEDRFPVIFSGSQGYNQDMGVILDAAERLRGRREIVFMLIGDGTQHEEMVRLSRRRRLDNVVWLPWQEDADYPLVMQSAGVVLATLKAEVGTPVVPSKILSAMSAGRAVITAMPLEGDAPKLVADAEAGFTVPPGDAEALARRIGELAGDRGLAERLGRNGRTYVEQHFDVNHWAEEHVRLFAFLAAEGGGGEAR